MHTSGKVKLNELFFKKWEIFFHEILACAHSRERIGLHEISTSFSSLVAKKREAWKPSPSTRLVDRQRERERKKMLENDSPIHLSWKRDYLGSSSYLTCTRASSSFLPKWCVEFWFSDIWYVMFQKYLYSRVFDLYKIREFFECFIIYSVRQFYFGTCFKEINS